VFEGPAGSMSGEMRITFIVSLIAMAMLFVTLWKLELTSKNASMQLARLRKRLEPDEDGDEPEPLAQPVGAAR
jgi:heme exporter protein C